MVWQCFYGKNGQIKLFGKIFSNLLLYVNYLAIYHCFVTRVHETRVLHVT